MVGPAEAVSDSGLAHHLPLKNLSLDWLGIEPETLYLCLARALLLSYEAAFYGMGPFWDQLSQCYYPIEKLFFVAARDSPGDRLAAHQASSLAPLLQPSLLPQAVGPATAPPLPLTFFHGGLA